MKTLLISAFASAILVAGVAYADEASTSQVLLKASIATTK